MLLHLDKPNLIFPQQNKTQLIMSTPEVPQLVGQLNAVLQDLPKDEAARKALLEATRKAALALESPGDTIQRIAYLVRARSVLTLPSTSSKD